MRHPNRTLHVLILAAALAAPLALTGCLFHHQPGSAWGSIEEPHYERWERATRRPHVLYNLRSDDEQHAYWEWRREHA